MGISVITQPLGTCCSTGMGCYMRLLIICYAAAVEWAPESAAQYDVSALEQPPQSESSLAAAQREEERRNSSFTLQQCLEVISDSFLTLCLLFFIGLSPPRMYQ